MRDVYNFSAGPSTLPVEVLENIKKDLLNFNNTGCSVMEISHRSKPYLELNDESIVLMKKLLNIDDEYSVLFLQGGAYTQFSNIAKNFASENDLTLYTVTGNFSNKAYIEGKIFSNAKIIASSEDKNFSYIPDITDDMIDKNAKYLHICLNNTVFGTCYNKIPSTGQVPLIGDMSSIIFGKKYDFNKFSMIYGGAQKNIGIAGVTFVVLKNSMLENIQNNKLSSMDNYKIQSNANSIFNTPPVFAIYVLNLMLKWVLKMGGVEELSKRAIDRTNKVYDLIDNSKIYKGTARSEDRSPMNVTFVCSSDELNDKFVNEAKENGLINLKGHKSAGGIRASIYNAMEDEGVDKLIDFMKKFEKNNS